MENALNRPASASTPGLKTRGIGSSTPKTLARPASAASAAKGTLRPGTAPMTPSASVQSSGGAAREAAKQAKLASTAERIRRTSELRAKWAAEKEEKVSKNSERRSVELERLKELNTVAAEQRRAAAEKNKEIADRAKASRLESLARSCEDRALQQAELDKQAKMRRRMSVMLNAEIKAKATENEKKLAAKAKAGEEDILATRRQDFLEIREIKRAEAEQQRQMLAQKGVEAQRAREAEQALQQKRQEEERSRIEFRRHMWKADQAARADEAKARKEALALRLDAWRASRAQDGEAEQLERQELKDLLETRKTDWEALQTYKLTQAARDRQSIAARLDAWREDKSAEEKRRREQDERDEMERELKQAELADLAAMKEARRREERDSLACRLGKASDDRAAEQEQERQRKEADARERELSLQALGDVKAAQEQERQRQRQSLAEALHAAKRQHEADLEQHNQTLLAMHADLEAKRVDWIARSEAKQHESANRRMSVALRLDSWREQRMAEEMLAQSRALREAEDARLREEDREAVLETQRLARLAEATDRLRGSMVL